MIGSALLAPGELVSRFHLERVRDGALKLDQWGYETPVDPNNPDGGTRRVTFFEVVRNPNDKAENAAAGALLHFTSKHAELPEEPTYLGTVAVTDSYIKGRFSKE